MVTLKTLAVAAALVVGAGAMAGSALAQNGPATGNESPVAGGAGASGKSAVKHAMTKHNNKKDDKAQ